MDMLGAKIDVQFTEIVQTMHKMAMEQIGKAGTRFVFQDTAFHADGKFVGPGQHLIMVVFKDLNGGSAKHSQCANVIKEYLKMLTGTDYDRTIRDDYVSNITHVSQPTATHGDRPQEQGLVKEDIYISWIDRYISESIDTIFESNGEPSIGGCINYVFHIQGASDIPFKDAISKAGDRLLGGEYAASDIKVDMMGGDSLASAQKFNTQITVRGSEIMTNLHNKAVQKSAKKIGLKYEGSINQFIINSGMSDNGTSVSNIQDRINDKVRFHNAETLEIGIVLEASGVKPLVGVDRNQAEQLAENNKKIIQDTRKTIFEGINEYLRWFSGSKVNEDDMQMFIPQYNDHRVVIRDGRIQDSGQLDDTISRFTNLHYRVEGKDLGENTQPLRIGYKIAYRMKWDLQ